MDESNHPSLRENVVAYGSREEADAAERAYWQSKSPAERLAAAEILRQSVYNYDPATARIRAIAEFIERPAS